MTFSRTLARPMLASIFLVGGVSALKSAPQLAATASPVTDRVIPLARRLAPQLPIPSDPTLLVRANALTQIVAATGLATGRAPRLSSAVLGATLVPTTLAAHNYWDEADPAKRGQMRVQFFKNLSVLGGLILAGVDTDGKPGLAWRARRAASDARREARALAATARREAKLVAAHLS